MPFHTGLPIDLAPSARLAGRWSAVWLIERGIIPTGPAQRLRSIKPNGIRNIKTYATQTRAGLR
jgi:hypothetical protein